MLDKLKNAWRSKTIWFNGLLLAGLPLFGMLIDAMPQLQAYLPENVYKTMGAVAVIGNMVLRFLTTRPLEAK